MMTQAYGHSIGKAKHGSEVMKDSLPDGAQIIRDWVIDLSIDQVLRAQGADPDVIRSKHPGLVNKTANAVQVGSSLLQPVALMRTLRVKKVQHERLTTREGEKLSGKLVVQHLAPAKFIVVVICSIGEKIELHARRLMQEDPVMGFALDSFGSAAAEALSNQVHCFLGNQSAQNDLEISLPISPGMVGWPVDRGQEEIFTILDGSQIGVTLNDYQMMTPKKSISMVIGVGPEMENVGKICLYCNKQASCRYQDHYV